MPWLQRLPQLDLDAVVSHRAVDREAELEMRREPFQLDGEARLAQLRDHVLEVLPNELGQHEAVVKLGAPGNELALEGLLPEPGDQRAQEKLLREAHARVRRHLEGAELDEAEPPR